jgi:hypothetical protein
MSYTECATFELANYKELLGSQNLKILQKKLYIDKSSLNILYASIEIKKAVRLKIKIKTLYFQTLLCLVKK